MVFVRALLTFLVITFDLEVSETGLVGALNGDLSTSSTSTSSGRLSSKS